MRSYNYPEILNWLIGIHLKSDDPREVYLAGEAIDLIKDQKKWLNRSNDMRAVYTAAFDLGYEKGLKENGGLT